MPFSDVKFNLDVSGIAGFFGGEESIAAKASVNLVRYTWLLGWYNSPGSYLVSRKYGIIAGTRFWDGIFQGPGSNPAKILGLDGMNGPRFVGAQSGTVFAMTGHLAHLLFSHWHSIYEAPPTTVSITKYPNSLTLVRLPTKDESATNGQLPASVLQQLPISNIRPFPGNGVQQAPAGPQPLPPNGVQQQPANIQQIPVNGIQQLAANVQQLVAQQSLGNPLPLDCSMDNHITSMSVWGLLFTFITIGSSMAAGIVAAVVWEDFACFTAIAIGILANGFATLVYGSATLKLERPLARPHAVDGDGVFVQGNDIVILEGPEREIATVIRGRYKLTYNDGPSHHLLGCVSIALVVQVLSQLILLPVATLKGQGIFLATFAVSWLYNAYLASVDREKLQLEVLNRMLGCTVGGQTTFPTWAGAVAASAFYLHPVNPEAWLSQLIPNETPVWAAWREVVAEAVRLHSIDQAPSFALPDRAFVSWHDDDRNKLKEYLTDAQYGYDMGGNFTNAGH